MATVQGIQDNNQGNNWVLPTVGGAVVGAGAGSTVLASAKYKTFGDLVKEATSNDKFEMPKAPEKAAQEVTDNFKVVTDEVDAVKNRLKAVGELFTGETKEVAAGDVLKAVGKTDAADTAKFTKDFELAQVVKGLKKDEAVDISDAMKAVFKTGDNVDESALKTALSTMGTYTDAVMEGDVVKTAAKFTPNEAGIKAATDMASGANEAAVNFIKNAKDGKVTKEVAEEFAKTAQDAKVGSAFEAIQKQLGKSRVKGAVIWGAIGLAVGYIVSKLIGGGNQKEAA